MRLLFGFFLRFFLGLVAAKLFNRLWGLEGTGALLALALLFTISAYGISYLLSRDGQGVLVRSEAKAAAVSKDSRP